MEKEDMLAEVQRRWFTVDDYYRMAEVGILDSDERVELIEGEIVPMSPIGDRHAGVVNRITDLFTYLFRGKAVVTVHNPVRLNKFNEPQPDLTLSKWRADFYSSHHPIPEDVLLAVEVADTTLRKDLKLKLPIYARLGIKELCVVNLKKDEILLFRDPKGEEYKTQLNICRGQSFTVLAFPETTITAEQILG